MLYELQVLRRNTPLKSRAEAISNLDNFSNHLIGQPCVVLYEDKGKVKALFAVGKKNYGTEDYEVPSSENYEIINCFTDSTIYWERFSEDLGSFIPTEDKVEFTFADADTFYSALDGGVARDNQVAFVNDPETNIYKIYKGDQVYATNSIFELIADRDLPDFGIEAGDDFISILYKLKDSLNEMSLKWNTDEDFKLYALNWGEHKDTVKTLEDERSFFEVDMTSKFPYANVKAHYINENQIGDAYISNIEDKSKEMEYNLGEFTVGTTIEDVYELTGHSINDLIDKILFPKNLYLNYGIITKEQILSLFDGSAPPFDPDADDDHVPDIKPKPEEKEEHVLISKNDIIGIIERLDDDYDPSDISGELEVGHTLISKDAIDDIIEKLDE